MFSRVYELDGVGCHILVKGEKEIMVNTNPMFILVGPTASGKSTITSLLEARLNMEGAVLTTSRNKYRHESWHTYHFVPSQEFKRTRMVLTRTAHSGTYGLSVEEANISDIASLYPEEAQVLRAFCASRGRPCYLIGLPITRREQAERMVKRGDPAKEIDRCLMRDAVLFDNFEQACDTCLKAPTVEELYTLVEEFIRLSS